MTRMPSEGLRLLLHGVRGSVPTASPTAQRYGGDTICFEVDLGRPEHRLLIDCGTGVRHVAVDAEDAAGTTFDILFSHFHWDHLEGLGFFPPVFREQHRFTFHGRPEGLSVQEALEGALRPPWFPIALAETPSEKRYTDMGGSTFTIEGVAVTPLALSHPQGVTGYRFDAGGRSIAIATDHEAGTPEVDAALVEWARGVDVLIHDAQYTAADYEEHRGWGHSTWDAAIEAATAAEVGRLVTISHDPSRTDDEIDALVASARKRFAETSAARAGEVIEV
jgi:phosphoribosyl 1,2-cyclic phosphodiesterase